MSGVSHSIVTPPLPPRPDDCDAQAWEAFYPNGSYVPSGPIRGGFSFYVAGPESFKQALMKEDATEVVVGYDVLFEKGFDFVKGGKLPGVHGGVGDLAYRCSGGRKEERCKCFDFRLMFRADGAGELYAYAPLTENNASRFLAVPSSRNNTDYGISVGRGLFSFHPGTWTSIAIRVRLNEAGAEDGEVELYVDGRSVIRVVGLRLREDAAARVKGMHFQTFFGGATPEWASSRDQRAWFATVSGGIIPRLAP
ncbi:hypothetical protein K488DRAFT_79393 [Vararia minispora EC-137]|uniref:Uncharacterized protein n=1 Tax=Vararia minispora EC-137 TaxID=1314806 RepID=A0ACB8QH36_9AGAM|nr:hypothetical protein K488DRAFT_79393 [Vararia minispora EC-137]